MSTHISMNTHYVCSCNNEDCRLNGCLMLRQRNEAGGFYAADSADCGCSTRLGGSKTTKALTDEQKAKFVNNIIEYGAEFVAPLFSVVESIEQAILQSEQVQAWKRDASRYRWLRNRASTEGICVVHIDYWSEEYRGQAHCEVYDGEFLDKEIDASMEKQP